MNIASTRCKMRIFGNARSLTCARRLSTGATGHSTIPTSHEAPNLSSKYINNTSITSQNGPSTSSEDSPTTTAPTTATTHYKITLHRSAIGLPKRYKDTLTALGIRRRGQIVFHEHSPSAAGKILRVKELVKVENVTEHQVKTPREIHESRQPVRGYVIKKKYWENGASSSTSWLDGL